MRILIVGTGAMACLFAARLAAVEAEVTMLGSWPEGLAQLRAGGVRLVEEDGAERAFPVRAVDDTAQIPAVDHALVLVKAWATRRAGAQLRECLSPAGVALTLQNGLGNRLALVEALGDGRVALGVTTYGATLLGPGHVRAGGAGSLVVEYHPRLKALVERLKLAGFPVELVNSADSLLWSKLVVNAGINPLGALLRKPNGELLNSPDIRAVMRALAEEAASVARAQGISLIFPDPMAAVQEVARRTAGNFASMYQDVLRGAVTEIDAICGAIVQNGQAYGVPTPYNRAIWQLVRGLHPS